MSKKCSLTADEIISNANSIPRPIEVPNVIVGYIGDLLIKTAKAKIKEKSKISQPQPG
jgi:hypothetical protein